MTKKETTENQEKDFENHVNEENMKVTDESAGSGPLRNSEEKTASDEADGPRLLHW